MFATKKREGINTFVCAASTSLLSRTVLLKNLSRNSCIQLFRQRLSHQCVKAYATMSIGIMGRKSLALLG